jgi:hypothetical protein
MIESTTKLSKAGRSRRSDRGLVYIAMALVGLVVAIAISVTQGH